MSASGAVFSINISGASSLASMSSCAAVVAADVFDLSTPRSERNRYLSFDFTSSRRTGGDDDVPLGKSVSIEETTAAFTAAAADYTVLLESTQESSPSEYSAALAKSTDYEIERRTIISGLNDETTQTVAIEILHTAYATLIREIRNGGDSRSQNIRVTCTEFLTRIPINTFHLLLPKIGAALEAKKKELAANEKKEGGAALTVQKIIRAFIPYFEKLHSLAAKEVLNQAKKISKT
jgi:hypothetical protein